MAKWPDYPNIFDTYETFARFDPVAKDLLKKLVDYDPTKRITAKEALKHAYFKAPFSDSKFVISSLIIFFF